MLKVLPFMTFILFAQAVSANDFLRSEKQLLVCIYAGTKDVKGYNEHFVRINWDAWDIEKTYGVKAKNYNITLSPKVDREGIDHFYEIKYSWEYKLGSSESGKISIGPELEKHDLNSPSEILVRTTYVDVALPDSEMNKTCQKNFHSVVKKNFSL